MSIFGANRQATDQTLKNQNLQGSQENAQKEGNIFSSAANSARNSTPTTTLPKPEQQSKTDGSSANNIPSGGSLFGNKSGGGLFGGGGASYEGGLFGNKSGGGLFGGGGSSRPSSIFGPSQPRCFKCKTELYGYGNFMCDTNCYFLGINGYVLYSNTEIPGWFSLYCKTCWEKEVLSLPFVESKISSQEEKIKSLIFQVSELSKSLSKIIDQQSLKDQELRSLNQLQNDVKDKLAKNELLLKEKDLQIQRLTELGNVLPKFPALDSLKEILSKLDQDRISILKLNGLSPESLNLTTKSAFKCVLSPILHKKLESMSKIFEKLITESEQSLEKIEKIKQDAIENFREIGALQNDEILDALKPLQKKQEKEKSLMEQWRRLQEEVSTLMKEDPQETFQ